MIPPVAISHPSGSPGDLKAAAQGFEAIFLREIIGAMRKGKLAEDILGSSASDSFRDMADARTADDLARLGHFGIAGMIEAQLGGRRETKA